MNPFKVFTEKERQLISRVSKIENRDYNNEETSAIERNIIEDILRRSSKNGDLQRANAEYSDILYKLQKNS